MSTAPLASRRDVASWLGLLKLSRENNPAPLSLAVQEKSQDKKSHLLIGVRMWFAIGQPSPDMPT